MSQSIVTIRLNGTPYQIGCGEGEEAHIESLAGEIETILQSLVGAVGQIGEARLLAMAALILADRAHEGGPATGASATGASATGADDGGEAAAAALESAADRILALASRLSSH
ncbi:MAG: cell division protein ZapA [Alphaproteobacteria bacterium]|nr:cell division protein ZapA [Alphaproteobacteria bacterium]